MGHCARWTPEQDRALMLLWGEHEPEAIARRLPGPPRTPLAIIERGRRLGYRSPGRGHYSQRDVARHLGIWSGCVLPLARRCGIRVRRRPHSEKWSGRQPGCTCRRPYSYTHEQMERMAERLREELNGVA